MSEENGTSQLGLKKPFPKSMWGFAAVVLIAVALILLIMSIARFYTFKEDVNNLMHISAVSVSREIEATLEDLRRDVAIFAAEHSELLSRIYRDKDYESREFINLKNTLERRVPDMFTFTIANEDGSEILDEFNFDVGDICKIDIQNFVLNTYRPEIRIHPLPGGYHFDVMVPFVGFNNEVLVFFVSFIPREISRILESYTNPNYEVIVSSTLHQGLIEITEHGSRDMISEPFYLTNQVVGSSIPIKGTAWESSVVPKPGLYSSYIKSIIEDAAILFGLFILTCTPMFVIIVKQFRKKQSALLALKESENRYFDLYEYAPDMYMTITEQGNIVLANGHAREFFARDQGSLESENISDLLDPESAQALRELSEEMYRTDLQASQIELVRNEKFGSKSILHARLRLTSAVQNEARNLLIVCRDVTTQKNESQRKLMFAQAQRDSLVREVHHRIKNNLQNVVSLLTTYSRKTPDLQPIIHDASAKISSIAEAYGLQSRSTKSIVYIGDLVTAIIENERKLFLSQLNLSISDELRENGKVAEREITPVAVILSELVTNAIKHGEKSLGARVVHVNLTKEAESVRIEIINGIRKDALDSRTPSNLTSGQGLSLIRSLLPPQGATLTHTEKNFRMHVVLKLFSPQVITFAQDQLRKFAT